MKYFDKQKFISELKGSIGEFLNDTEFNDEQDVEEEVNEFINNYIQNQTIYYIDCWSICYTLGATDFEIEQLGTKAKNINELAYWSLWSLVDDSVQTYLEEKILIK